MKKYSDITNKKFGNLIAIERVDGRWLCRCDCGNTSLVRFTDLKSGNTKSCGCLHKQMMSETKSKDITGKRFGKLTVIEKIGVNNKKRIIWKCLCDCGSYTNIQTSKFGVTKSCGCLHKTPKSNNVKRHELYETWCGIKKRCNNDKCKAYINYGGRGITVCERWSESFLNFLEDMGEKPNKLYSLDRIDNNKHYSCGKCKDCKINGFKFNCRWADRKTQNSNKRSKEEIQNDRQQYCLQDKNKHRD